MIELDQKKYLERRKQDLMTCLSAVQTDSYETIETVGHKIKGNGMTFGFPELSAIGAQIETAAQQKNKVQILKTTDELKAWVDAHSN